jgi:hypothetical protein
MARSRKPKAVTVHRIDAKKELALTKRLRGEVTIPDNLRTAMDAAYISLPGPPAYRVFITFRGRITMLVAVSGDPIRAMQYAEQFNSSYEAKSGGTRAMVMPERNEEGHYRDDHPVIL